MTNQYDGRRVFWDEHGDCDTVCDLCYSDIPVGDLHPDADRLLAGLDFPQVYITEQMEVDCPLHCDWCGRPIKHRLTGDGVDYVLEALEVFIESPVWGVQPRVGNIDYYDGTQVWSVLWDWADDLQWYGLDENEQEIVDKFLETVNRLEASASFRAVQLVRRKFSRARWKIFLAKRKVGKVMDGLYQDVVDDIREFEA